MTKLDFDFHSPTKESDPHFIAYYEGYRVLVYLDLYPECPWEAWDCEPPVITYTGHRDGIRTWGDIDVSLPVLTTEQILTHKREIARYLNPEGPLNCSLLRAIGEYRSSYHTAEHAVNELLEEVFQGTLGNEKLDMLADVLSMAGIDNYLGTRNGYCQGDWAEILVVATPEWIKKVGAYNVSKESLEHSADLWAAWAFGDVYRYSVKDPDGFVIDACGGYYGNNHNENGLAEQALSAIKADIESKRKERTRKVKAFLKHRVPLDSRSL